MAGGTVTTVVTVPITASSRRKWRLMEEDSITLSFTLGAPVELRVGDFIEDELFGAFRIREKVMPTYQKATGAYDYTVRFDSFYWQWERFLFMLTALPKGGQESARYRKEASWMLTATLKEHAFEVIRNVRCLWDSLRMGYDSSPRPYCVLIHDTTAKADEVRFLAYDGMRICSALTQMANEYGCEWWVTVGAPDTEHSLLLPEDTGGWQDGEYTIIHFGKCEGTDEALPLRLGYNVEEMSINRNASDYANRIYIMGGKTNMPESYRKRIMLDVEWKNRAFPALLQDDDRKIQTAMLGSGTTGSVTVSLQKVGTPQSETGRITVVYEGSFTNGRKVVWGGVSAEIGLLLPEGFASFYSTSQSELEITPSEGGGTSITLASDTKTFHWTEGTGESGRRFSAGNALDDGLRLLDVGAYTLRLTQTLTYSSLDIPSVIDSATNAAGAFEVTLAGEKRTMTIALYDEGNEEWTEYAATYNPSYLDASLPESHYFAIDGLLPPGQNTDEVLEAFARQLTTSPYTAECELRNVPPLEVPFSYYTSADEDPSCVTSIGERRLMLPEVTGGYLQQGDRMEDGAFIRDGLEATEIEDMTAVSEDIYPRCYLRVTDVVQNEREYREELSDGSYNVWTQTVYVLLAENINGQPFPFSSKYVKDGEKLQAVFLSEIDEDKAYQETYGEGYETHIPPRTVDGLARFLLAGMTFDVNMEGYNYRYTLISNEDYGAKLPNDLLFPKEGDTFVLTGWDVKAMESLGLIEAAENRLLDFGLEYLDALEEDQFTFECTMMSDWPWMLYGGDSDSYGSVPLDENEGAPLYEVDEKRLYCVNGTYFRLPDPGARVAVYHEALKDTKETRIIGYEYKLDIPYDTPHITVGETEAYSRLKQLEKKITKK